MYLDGFEYKICMLCCQLNGLWCFSLLIRTSMECFRQESKEKKILFLLVIKSVAFLYFN